MSKTIQLWGPVTADTTAETVFTNVTGKASILDTMIMANPSSGAATTVRLAQGTDGATTRIVDYTIPAGVGTYVIYPGNVLTSTTIYQLSSTSTDDVVVTTGNGREFAV